MHNQLFLYHLILKSFCDLLYAVASQYRPAINNENAATSFSRKSASYKSCAFITLYSLVKITRTIKITDKSPKINVTVYDINNAKERANSPKLVVGKLNIVL